MSRFTLAFGASVVLLACGGKTQLGWDDQAGGAGGALSSTHGVGVSSTHGVGVSSTNVVTVGVSSTNVSVGVSTHAVSVGVTSNVSVAVSTGFSVAVSTGSGMPLWTCDPAYFGDGLCDCGCGSVDPDCPTTTSEVCQYCDDPGSCNSAPCPGTIDHDDNAVCFIPEDCENGIDDDGDGAVDCGDPDCVGVGMCPPVPWSCPVFFYGTSDGCDCGCGSVDPDCGTSSVSACVFCNDGGSCNTAPGCPGTINTVNSGICGSSTEVCNNGLDDDADGFVDCDDLDCLGQPGCAPTTWTCIPAWFGEGNPALCDCGCGAHDPDCPDSTTNSCVYCNDEGACSAGQPCPSNLDPNDNSVCL